MNVYEAIAARRTIRDFDTRPVDGKVLRRILDAGMKAPSHNHLRDWHFILVDDVGQRECLVGGFLKDRTEEELRELLDGWGVTDERQYAMYLDAIPKQAAMILDAGALVVPCFRQRGPLLGEKKSLHELNALASIWGAIENVLVASAGEGVFGVTKIVSTPEERDHVRTTLCIPDDYEIPCYLALGYPAAGAVRTEQVSVGIDDWLHIDRWGG